jgi:hypothetical protein
MDKTIVAELSATLNALRSAGETGFWILVVFLLLVISLVVVAVLYQRMVISRFQAASKAAEETFRSVDTQLKTMDTSLKERELGIKERGEHVSGVKDQVSIVKDINTVLQTEMARLRDQQRGFRDSLNGAITAGLQDIRDRLTQTSVKEIIAQVPETFRKDLEAEFSASLQTAISRINTHLQEKDVMHEYITAVTERLRDELKQMMPDYVRNFDPRLIVPELISQAVLEETGRHDLAERVARRVWDRYESRLSPWRPY